MSEKRSKRTQIKPIDEVIVDSENWNELMDTTKEELAYEFMNFVESRKAINKYNLNSWN